MNQLRCTTISIFDQDHCNGRNNGPKTTKFGKFGQKCCRCYRALTMALLPIVLMQLYRMNAYLDARPIKLLIKMFQRLNQRSKNDQIWLKILDVLSGKHILQVLLSFLLSCIETLSFIITGHRGLFFFKEDFTCNQCNVCTDTEPPILSPIR